MIILEESTEETIPNTDFFFFFNKLEGNNAYLETDEGEDWRCLYISSESVPAGGPFVSGLLVTKKKILPVGHFFKFIQNFTQNQSPTHGFSVVCLN